MINPSSNPRPKITSSSTIISPFSASSEKGGQGGGVYNKMSFIGGGKMAQALLSPLVNTSIQPETKIAMYDVSNPTMQAISRDYPHLQTCKSIPEVVQDSDLIIFAVKPQNLCKVYEEIHKAEIRHDATILSIIAGKPISSFVQGTGIQKVARSMPNTPAQIGQGLTVWACTSNIDSDERQKIDAVLGSFGKS